MLHSDKIEELYSTHYGKLYAIAMNVLKSREDSEDAVHDAFVSLSRHPEILQKKKKEEVVGYLVVSVKNAAISILRKRRDDEELVEELSGDDNTDDIVNEIHSKEQYKRVIDCIRAMDERYRIVLWLHFVEEKSVPEICKYLGRSENTVKSQLKRGKESLINALKRGGGD